MKKSLIALAVLAASGAAMAQSSVTLYGIADVIIHKDKDVSAKMTNGGISSSRLGFKGSEDLGGGLQANFKIERGVGLDTGSEAGGWDRYAYVGLSGGFGEIKLGKTGTAYDDISGATNGLWDSKLSPENSVWASTAYDWNPGNSFYYATPTFGGVSAALSTNLKEDGDMQSNSFNVTYNGGPVYAGVAYQVDKNTGSEVKYTRVNGSYDLGVAKLLAGYGNVKEGASKTNEYSLGADVPLSANLMLSASYASSKLDVDGAERSSGVGVAVAYSLSKRTTVYGGYLDTKNVGPDTRFGLGVKHTF